MAVLEKIIHYIDINYIQKFVTEYSKQMENNLKMVCFNALNEKEKDLFCYNFELFKNSGHDVYSEDKTQSEVVEDVETKIGLDTLAICDEFTLNDPDLISLIEQEETETEVDDHLCLSEASARLSKAETSVNIKNENSLREELDDVAINSQNMFKIEIEEGINTKLEALNSNEYCDEDNTFHSIKDISNKTNTANNLTMDTRNKSKLDNSENDLDKIYRKVKRGIILTSEDNKKIAIELVKKFGCVSFESDVMEVIEKTLKSMQRSKENIDISKTTMNHDIDKGMYTVNKEELIGKFEKEKSLKNMTEQSRVLKNCSVSSEKFNNVENRKKYRKYEIDKIQMNEEELNNEEEILNSEERLLNNEKELLNEEDEIRHNEEELQYNEKDFRNSEKKLPNNVKNNKGEFLNNEEQVLNNEDIPNHHKRNFISCNTQNLQTCLDDNLKKKTLNLKIIKRLPENQNEMNFSSKASTPDVNKEHLSINDFIKNLNKESNPQKKMSAKQRKKQEANSLIINGPRQRMCSKKLLYPEEIFPTLRKTIDKRRGRNCKAKHNNTLKKQINELKYQNKKFKCEICSYGTDYEGVFSRHNIMHFRKSSNEQQNFS